MSKTVKEWLDEAEKNLEMAFLTMAFEDLHKIIEEDNEYMKKLPEEDQKDINWVWLTDIPETVGEFLDLKDEKYSGYQDIVRHDARRAHFIWASKYCAEMVSRRI